MEETMKDCVEDHTDATQMALLQAFATLNAHTVVNEDGSIHVWYQGKTLEVFISNFLVRIWDMYWRTYSQNDPKPRIKDAVNFANYQPFATVIFTETEDDFVYLHTKMDFMFTPNIPHQDEFLYIHLREFDLIRNRLDTYLDVKDLT